MQTWEVMMDVISVLLLFGDSDWDLRTWTLRATYFLQHLLESLSHATMPLLLRVCYKCKQAIL